MSRLSRSLWRATLILAYPLVLYVFMRFYVRRVLGVGIGFRFGSDYDFVFPALLAFFCLFCALDRVRTAVLKLSVQRLLWHGIFLLAFLGLSLKYASSVAWWVSCSALLLSGFFLLLPLKYYIYHSERKLILPAVLVGTITILAKTVFDFLWEPTGRFTGRVLCGLLGSVDSSMSCRFGYTDFAGGPEYTHLMSPLFTIAVGKGCSGLEGMFLFAGIFGLILISDPKRPGWGGGTLMFTMGLFFLYALNLFRVVFFYGASFYAYSRWGHDTAVPVLLSLLHTCLGWILYGVGIFFFIRAVYWHWREDKATSPYPHRLPFWREAQSR